MPAPDEHIWQTSIAEWPEALRSLCLPFEQLDISEDDQNALIALSGGKASHHGLQDAVALSGDFITNLDDVLQSYPSGAHVRFDLCSLKLGSRAPKIFTSKDILSILERKPQRISSSLISFANAKHETHLFVFPWRDIPAWTEFRLFIQNRKIVGVSQYHHHETFPEIQHNLEPVKASLFAFSANLINALHMDTVVADVCTLPQPDGSFSTTLIELNPFIMRTAPCLYSWQNGGDFDNAIRYRQPRFNPYYNTPYTV